MYSRSIYLLRLSNVALHSIIAHMVTCTLCLISDVNEYPTLPELTNFGEKKVNVIEGIGDRYHTFGIKLLDDVKGNKMEIIKHDEHTAEGITRKVFSRWIRGEGMEPKSWATLATVLDECNLTALSREIRSVKAILGKFYLLMHLYAES